MTRLRGERLIAEAKITRYLLDADHPVGRSKAVFFASFGFSLNDAGSLIEALLAHPGHNDVVSREETEFGAKFTVECSIPSPDGRTRAFARCGCSNTAPKSIGSSPLIPALADLDLVVVRGTDKLGYKNRVRSRRMTI